jgi:chromosome partitioning protein
MARLVFDQANWRPAGSAKAGGRSRSDSSATAENKMAAKVIVVANMKGGVGKTTTVIALAEYLAAYGVGDGPKKVAVIDLDAQASASISIAGNGLLRELIETGRTVDAFLEDRIVYRLSKPGFADVLRGHASSVTARGEPVALGLIAASPELRQIEREIIYSLTEQGYGLRAIETQTRKLTEPQIESLRSKLDYILVDCPPGISVFSEVMFSIADIVLTPVIPDFISTRGLAAFCRNVLKANPQPLKHLPRVLINRYTTSKHHRETIDALRKDASGQDPQFTLLDTMVPSRADIERALEMEAGSTFESRWGSVSADIYRKLALELVGKPRAWI